MQLTVQGCRRRQERLLEQMKAEGISLAILSDPRHVLWAAGYLTGETHKSVAILQEDGKCLLVSSSEPMVPAVDEHIRFEASELCTLKLDQAREIVRIVGRLVEGKDGNWGLDAGGSSACFWDLGRPLTDLDPVLFDLRRFKEPDELDLLKGGIAVNEGCYERAREFIEPGMTELEVYAELYRTAVSSAGCRIPAMGNDFQSGTAGGPPRLRKLEQGELYILDLGVQLWGYFSDNARTLAVGRNPSPLQRHAWGELTEVFSFVEQTVRPGVSCRSIYTAVKRMLDREWPGAFFHHLGHGVGLSAHEGPFLNPHWDDYFQVGDFFTVEPGVYSPELRGGIRLEENYLVTPTGVSKLSTHPLDLT